MVISSPSGEQASANWVLIVCCPDWRAEVIEHFRLNLLVEHFTLETLYKDLSPNPCSQMIAVFWILRTGAPWRDLPPDYGDWKNTHRRFCRWRDKGIGEKLLTTRSKTILLFALMATSRPLMPIIHGKAITN